MWIVKIGGSLSRDPVLKDWLDRLCEIGRGRVVIVPGGAGFADLVRAYHDHWSFDELNAHNMAVLAMAQYGLLMQGICGELVLAASEEMIRQALRQARVAVWMPFEALREQADELTQWSVTSDSLSAWLSSRMNAEHLVLVKACEVEPGAAIDRYVESGVVDEKFGVFTRSAAYRIDILNKNELGRMRELLLATQAAL